MLLLLLRRCSGLPPQRAVFLRAAAGLVEAAALLTEAQVPALLASHVAVHLLSGHMQGKARESVSAGSKAAAIRL